MCRVLLLDVIMVLWLICGVGKGLFSDGGFDDVFDVVFFFFDYAFGGVFDEEVEFAIVGGERMFGGGVLFFCCDCGVGMFYDLY